MPARKKTGKKQPKRNSVSAKRKSSQKKSKAPRDKTKTVQKKNKARKRRITATKRTAAKTTRTRTRRVRNRNQGSNEISARARQQADSGNESGDLQGLGTLPEADSESARELLEEGNAFEADVVRGVESAGDEPEREVHPRQVPEDDVPEEYLDRE